MAGLRQAWLAMDGGDLDTAERLAGSCPGKPDEAASWHRLLGRILVRRGRPGEALAQFAQVGEAGLDAVDAQYMARAAEQIDDWGIAEAAWRLALSRDQAAVPAWIGLGSALQRAGKPHEAELAYLEALARHPAAVAASANLAVLYEVALEDVDNAERCHLHSIRHAAAPAARLADYGGFLLARGRLHEAVGILERSLQAEPERASAWCDLGNARCLLGLVTEAADAFLKALERNPRKAGAYDGLGRALLRLGDRGAAAQAFRQAIELDPRGVAAMVELASIHEALGAFDDAEALLVGALAFSPDDVDVNAGIARVLQARGRSDEARAHFARAAASGGGAAMVLQGLLAVPAELQPAERSRLASEVGSRLEGFLAAEIVPEGEQALLRGGLTRQRVAHLALADDTLLRRAAQCHLRVCPILGYAAEHAMIPAVSGRRRRVAVVGRFSDPAVLRPELLVVLGELAACGELDLALVNVGRAEQIPALAELAARCGNAIAVPDYSLVDAQRAVARVEADVVLYAGLSRDAFTYFLAFARLGRVQGVLSAHGEIARLPSIDFAIPISDVAARPDEGTPAFVARLAAAAPPPLPEVYLPLVPLADACARQGGEYLERMPANYATVAEPQLVSAQGIAPEVERIARMPAIAAAVLSEVEVQGGESAVFLHRERCVVHVLGEHGAPERIRFDSAWIASRIGGHYLLATASAATSLDKAVVLLGEAAYNYYHWMLDHLPRLQALVDEPRFDDWPILVDKHLHDNLTAALRRVVGLERVLIPVERGERIRLAQAVILSGGTAIQIDPLPGARLTVGDVPISARAVEFLRQRVGGADLGAPRGRRLFLARRGSYRRLSNADEVETLFQSHGFELVRTEDLDLARQVALFSEAEVIAGPTGAAFTNLIFAPPTAKVLVLHVDVGLHCYYSNLAAAAGQRAIYVFGTPLPGTHEKAHQADFHVPLPLIAQALALMLPKATGSGAVAARAAEERSVARDRLGFLIHLPELINHYAPVWEHLPRGSFEVVMTGEPADRREIAHALKDAGITVSDAEEFLAGGRRFAYLVSNHPIDLGADPLIKRLGERNIRFMYGLGKAGWSFMDWNALYDLVLCFGPYQVNQMERFQELKKLQMGYPRFDAFFTTQWDAAALAREYGCDPDRPTVVWLPTWKNLSSVHLFADAVADLRGRYNVVIKLHPLQSRDEPETVRRLEALGFNCVISDSRDNVPLFRLADFVLCDYGGSVFGALYTDRRVLLLDMPGAEDDPLVGRQSPEILLRELIVHLGHEDSGRLADVLADDALWRHQDELRGSVADMFVAPFRGFAAKIAATYLENLEGIFSARVG